jgi:hypothetical protein
MRCDFPKVFDDCITIHWYADKSVPAGMVTENVLIDVVLPASPGCMGRFSPALTAFDDGWMRKFGT